MKRLILTILAVLALAAPASAQNSVPGATVVQPVQPLYACDQSFTATGVANTTVTLTNTAQANKTFYLCTLDIVEIANAAVTGAAGPAEVCTTTNLVNNLIWWGENGTLTTGQMKPVITLSWGAVPLKTLQPGVAFTVACTGGQSSYNVRANMTGFYQ